MTEHRWKLWLYKTLLILMPIPVTVFASINAWEDNHVVPEYDYCMSYDSPSLLDLSSSELSQMLAAPLCALLASVFTFGNDIKELVQFSSPKTLIGGKTQRKVEPLLQRIPFRMALISLLTIIVLIAMFFVMFLTSGPRAVQVVEALVLLFNIFKGPIAIFWTIRPNKLNAKEKTPAERQKEVIQLA